MSFMLKKLKISLSKKEWIKGVMRRLWFHELFDAVLFLRLMSVGEIATWVFLDWKGRALSKRGVVYGTLVFRTESVDGKQRKGFYVVSYSDEPCLEMVIFLYIPSCNSVLVWKLLLVRKLLWIRPNESSLKEGEGGGGLVVLNRDSSS